MANAAIDVTTTSDVATVILDASGSDAHTLVLKESKCGVHQSVLLNEFESLGVKPLVY
jgi:hypothetical protein